MKSQNLVGASNHYDESYFDWQKEIGDFGAWANRYKFVDYIKTTDRILDFGCGGGDLLANITCAKKFGVEPNEAAASKARKVLDQVFANSSELPKEFVDLVISNNALEHTLHHLIELKNLKECLVTNGKIVIVAPCENISYAYVPKDINHHLYSWSPMCLGNILEEAGFSLIESRPYIHKWPPNYRQCAILGWPVFNLLCRIYGQLNRKWFQVRAVAVKLTN
jgi:SAM-dependent methyltransferase